MLNKLSRISFPLVVIFSFTTTKVLAHGTIINYQVREVIEIEAKFDNGKPMANSQVVIHSPHNATAPWLTGVTDDKGKFVFTPDFSQQGDWVVKVRSAGHGNVINIPIESISIPKTNEINSSPSLKSQQTNENVMNKTSSSQEITLYPTMMQKLIMAAAGVWGFIGTALFFSRKKV